MTIPEASAAAGIPSPSSQLAWWGSPHAICTTLILSRSRKPFNSGMFLTCKLQLQTPRLNGGNAEPDDCEIDCDTATVPFSAWSSLLLIARSPIERTPILARPKGLDDEVPSDLLSNGRDHEISILLRRLINGQTRIRQTPSLWRRSASPDGQRPRDCDHRPWLCKAPRPPA
jgi:hypothetical protein